MDNVAEIQPQATAAVKRKWRAPLCVECDTRATLDQSGEDPLWLCQNCGATAYAGRDDRRPSRPCNEGTKAARWVAFEARRNAKIRLLQTHSWKVMSQALVDCSVRVTGRHMPIGQCKLSEAVALCEAFDELT